MKKSRNRREHGQAPGQSIFREAWENMTADLDRMLPERLRGGKGRGKFALWLFIAELVVLGAIGKAVYRWLQG